MAFVATSTTPLIPYKGIASNSGKLQGKKHLTHAAKICGEGVTEIASKHDDSVSMAPERIVWIRMCVFATTRNSALRLGSLIRRFRARINSDT